MSLAALTWAFSQPCGGDASTKFVLVAMCDWANEAWESYPSIAGLADKTNLDRKTIIACLDRLVEAGLIADTGDRKGATRQVKVYRMNVSGQAGNDGLKQYRKRNSSENGTVPFFPGKSTENGTGIRNGYTRDKEIPTDARACVREDAQTSFDAFWSVYPKRKSKAHALKAWAKLKPDGALVSRILAAVESQKLSADWQRDGGQFIPYPASWLNAAGWEDEATHVRPQWSEQQAQFIALLTRHLGRFVVPPTEWTAERADAIDGMIAKAGGDMERIGKSMELMAGKISPEKFGVQSFDWWAKPQNRDRIRARQFSEDGQ